MLSEGHQTQDQPLYQTRLPVLVLQLLLPALAEMGQNDPLYVEQVYPLAGLRIDLYEIALQDLECCPKYLRCNSVQTVAPLRI